jgi:hypothetical protein
LVVIFGLSFALYLLRPTPFRLTPPPPVTVPPFGQYARATDVPVTMPPVM